MTKRSAIAALWLLLAFAVAGAARGFGGPKGPPVNTQQKTSPTVDDLMKARSILDVRISSQ